MDEQSSVEALLAALGVDRLTTVSEKAVTAKICNDADRIVLEDGRSLPSGIPKNKQNVVVNVQYLKECLVAGRLLSPFSYTE